MNPGKRVALAIGVPFAAVALLGGSVAFAASQQADPTPSTPSTPTTPANPSQPGGGQNGQNGTPNGGTHDPANCPNMGGSGSGTNNGSSTNSSPQTGFHNRARGTATQARYY